MAAKGKKVLTAIVVLLLFPPFAWRCNAAEEETQAALDPAAQYYAAAWDALDDETAALLEELGLSAQTVESLFVLTPEGLISAVRRLFTESAAEIRGDFFTVLLLLVFSGFFLSFVDPGPNRELAGTVAVAVIVFSLAAAAARIADRCLTAVLLTADLIKGLLPVYAGVVAFSGNPGAAVELQTLVFAYAEAAGAWFSSAVPPFAALSVSLSAASALRPKRTADVLPSLIQRIVRFLMGFLAVVFSAVLSVRELLAEAGDSVALRGARFLLGGTVPVVGSAVGDALSSAAAGLAMAKTGVGLLGILAMALVNLPALIALLLWQAALYALSACAATLDDPRSGQFIRSLCGFFGTLAAALVFNMFVYVIALGLVLRAKGGG